MTKKIEEFIKRNRKRNIHLYQEKLIINVDYIICPHTKERLSMIKRNYIEKVLEMTVEEYDKLYPNTQKICSGRYVNISNGLKKIDEETGLTKYELSQVKAWETLRKVDENGKSGYKKLGENVRAAHMKNIDSMGRNGYSQIAVKAIIKGNQTKRDKGIIPSEYERNIRTRFREVVIYLTFLGKNRERIKDITKDYKMGKHDYHLDHIYSISKGRVNKVSPFVLANVCNLRPLEAIKNISKHDKCDIELDALLSKTGYTKEQSEKEFEIFYDIILEEHDKNLNYSGSRILNEYERIINGTVI